MKKRILVFNVGSSSIKYSLFVNLNLIDSGNYEKLKTKQDYIETAEKIIKKIDIKNIDAIAHRVVHGGELKKTIKITGEVKDKIKKFSKFAPLHNPKQLMIISLCERYKKPQYAVFDTAFFSDIPEFAKIYAIPKEMTKKYNIKRYGFHGLSHEFSSKGLKGKTIVCHLGSGSSVSAVINGKPIDISMGLTPLEGLIMGTRSGSIDPGIIFFVEKKGYKMEEILNEKSGLKGLTGFNDFRDILSRMNKNRECRLAYEMFVYSIIKAIGSYVSALNGLDNLVFTAKIGENVPKLREDVCSHFSFIGVEIDKQKNRLNEELISSKKSKAKVWIKNNNEEKMIVEKVLKLL
ncbi:MAG TPA: acetate/propionate family kinase [Patescibacteria group bacterium]|nr:acetate/propionate family kinase [Patescibacteria group bacterium]